MPELPEVETVRRELAPWLTGRRILDARRLDAPPGPKYAGLERAAGQRIEGVGRRGKFLILPLDGGDELIIHLGMTGVISPNAPAGHLRVVMDLGGPAPRRLHFQDVRRFGRFLVVAAGCYASMPTLARQGPEPFDPAFDGAALHAALRSRVAIKTLLLSQRPVAGLGNIYADEVLWRTRIHPELPASEVSARKAAALRDAIVEVLAASIEAAGTTLRDYRTVGGERGAFVSRLDAYGREGQPCRRCERPLRRIVVGARSSTLCPRCQRLR